VMVRQAGGLSEAGGARRRVVLLTAAPPGNRRSPRQRGTRARVRMTEPSEARRGELIAAVCALHSAWQEACAARLSPSGKRASLSLACAFRVPFRVLAVRNLSRASDRLGVVLAEAHGSHLRGCRRSPLHANARLAATGTGGRFCRGSLGPEGCAGPVGRTGCSGARACPASALLPTFPRQYPRSQKHPQARP
jgi:hypothetical protein